MLEAAGFDAPRVVEQQEQPDPDFPTVAFPNPEEPGAMDLAMALAEARGADLVVANDPDADRCAAAVPGPHGWRMLRGDEVGALLAHHLLARRHERHLRQLDRVLVACSGKMAAAAGQPYAETLTGFKWIGRVDGLAFGYEEALGYCVDPRPREGQGRRLRAAAALRARRRGQGRGPRPRRPARRHRLEHGLHATDQLSVRVGDLRLIAAAMARLRATPPSELGGLAVERRRRPRAGLAPTCRRPTGCATAWPTAPG